MWLHCLSVFFNVFVATFVILTIGKCSLCFSVILEPQLENPLLKIYIYIYIYLLLTHYAFVKTKGISIISLSALTSEVLLGIASGRKSSGSVGGKSKELDSKRWPQSYPNKTESKSKGDFTR